MLSVISSSGQKALPLFVQACMHFIKILRKAINANTRLADTVGRTDIGYLDKHIIFVFNMLVTITSGYQSAANNMTTHTRTHTPAYRPRPHTNTETDRHACLSALWLFFHCVRNIEILILNPQFSFPLRFYYLLSSPECAAQCDCCTRVYLSQCEMNINCNYIICINRVPTNIFHKKAKTNYWNFSKLIYFLQFSIRLQQKYNAILYCSSLLANTN